MNPPAQAQWTGDCRHHRFVAIITYAHLDFVFEVNAFDLFQKAVYEVLAGLFAIGDDVDPGVFLPLQPQQRRIAFRRGQSLPRTLPRGPQLVRFRQPFRLRQAAGDRRT